MVEDHGGDIEGAIRDGRGRPTAWEHMRNDNKGQRIASRLSTLGMHVQRLVKLFCFYPVVALIICRR